MKISKILKIIGLITIIIVSGMIYILFINPVSPRGSAEIVKDNLIMSVDYGRPYKKERLIFGNSDAGALVPYGKYWRLGANMATTFETNQKISFAGRLLDKGKYRMYVVPYKDSWKLTLNTEAGSFGYNEPNYELDILSINVSTINMSELLEQLTIDFIEDDLGISMTIRLDSTMVRVLLN